MGTEEETEQRRHERDMKMFDNFAANSLAAHQRNRPYFFAKGKPFYTEMKETNMYTKEFPDGGMLAVIRRFAPDGTIAEGFVEMLTESPMSIAQGTGVIYSRFSRG